MNKQLFFNDIRDTLFFGKLTVFQVAEIEFFLDYYNSKKQDFTEAQFAYILATVYHETGRTFLPVREKGLGRKKEYGKPVNGKVYYGRGYVQLTWPDNYQRVGRIIGIDLLGNPDLALLKEHAIQITFEGMKKGWFTGRKLSDYINEKECNFVEARRIINVQDKAKEIAEIAQKFLNAIKLSS